MATKKTAAKPAPAKKAAAGKHVAKKAAAPRRPTQLPGPDDDADDRLPIVREGPKP